MTTSFDSMFSEIYDVQNKVILIGETHGISETHDLYFNLILSFQKNIGVRNLLTERSYAEAQLYNMYLEDGNLEYLKYDVGWSKEMQAFFEKLYAYNLKLPFDQKIRFIGIDAIHSPNVFVLAVKRLIPNSHPPERIYRFVDSLRNVQIPLLHRPKNAKEHFLYMDNLKETFRLEILKNYEQYKKYFGDNFKHIIPIINSNSTYSKPGKRNNDMFLNFMRIVSEQHLTGGYLGLFGSNHVMNLKGASSFGQILNSSDKSLFKSHVYRILIHYEKSFANFNDKVVDVPGVLGVFLGKDESRFKSKLLSESGCSNFIMKTSDKLLDNCCHYLLFISNAKAVNRY